MVYLLFFLFLGLDGFGFGGGMEWNGMEWNGMEWNGEVGDVCLENRSVCLGESLDWGLGLWMSVGFIVCMYA